MRNQIITSIRRAWSLLNIELKEMWGKWKQRRWKREWVISSRKVWKTSSEQFNCHQWFNLNFMKRREYFLHAKKIKITYLFNNLSPMSLLITVATFWRISTGRKRRTLFCQLRYVFYVYLPFDLNKNSTSLWCGGHRTAYIVRPVDNLKNGTTVMRRDRGD